MLILLICQCLKCSFAHPSIFDSLLPSGSFLFLLYFFFPMSLKPHFSGTERRLIEELAALRASSQDHNSPSSDNFGNGFNFHKYFYIDVTD